VFALVQQADYVGWICAMSGSVSQYRGVGGALGDALEAA